MIKSLSSVNLKTFILIGAVIFGVCISWAYLLEPHWFTFSHFATRLDTLILFVIAMLTCSLLLWGIASELGRQPHLQLSSYILRTSALSALLILCVPYAGTSLQKSIHNLIVLVFVLLAAWSFAVIAKQLQNNQLAIISGILVGICTLELILIARINEHPVYPWVWVILQLLATILLITGLYVIAEILEQKKKPLRKAT